MKLSLSAPTVPMTSALVVDVGNTSVSLGAFDIGPDATTLLYRVHVDVPGVRGRKGKTILETRTIGAIAEACDALAAALPSFRPRVATIQFAMPWVVPFVRTITEEHPSPVPLSERDANAHIAKEIMHLLESDPVYRQEDLGVLESKVMRVALDGYPTRRPFDRPAARHEISLFLALSPISFTKGVTDTISAHWAIPDTLLSSFAFVAFDAIRDRAEDSFLFVDFSGAMTQAVCVSDGVVVATGSFGIGATDLVHAVAKATHMEASIAQETVTRALSGEQEHSSVDDAIEAFRAEWRTAFEDALHPKGAADPLPPHVIIATDPEFYPLASRLLAPAPPPVPPLPPDVIPSVSLRSVADVLPGDVTQADPFLSIGIRFAEKFIHLDHHSL